MTAALILIPTACYALACAAYAYQGNWPLAIVYSGYAFANCGLLMLDKMQG
jgi:hypothetical protein